MEGEKYVEYKIRRSLVKKNEKAKKKLLTFTSREFTKKGLVSKTLIGKLGNKNAKIKITNK